MSFRAYPAPSNNTSLHGNKSNGHARNPKNDGLSAATSRPRNFSGMSSTDPSSRSRVPGLSAPVLNPMKPVAPESKRRRAIPSTQPAFRSTADELTKMADEGIAKRRAQLRNLQAGRSSTADLLARAKSVTSGRGSASGSGSTNISSSSVPRTFSSHGGHAPPPQNNLNGNLHPLRTRPIALPKSPPRQRYTPNSNSTRAVYQRKPLVVSSNDNVSNIERNNATETTPKIVKANDDAGPAVNVSNIKTDENSLSKTENISVKPDSPNQEVKVHAQFVPSSEMAAIKPMREISEQVEANKLLSNNNHSPPIVSNDKKSSISRNETSKVENSSIAAIGESKKESTNAEKDPAPVSVPVSTSANVPTSVPANAPVSVPAQAPMPEAKEVSSSMPLISTTTAMTKENSVQEEKKAENNSPPLASEPSKRRETIKFLRNAALSPSVPITKKKTKQEQAVMQEGVTQIVTQHDGEKTMDKTNGKQITTEPAENNNNKALRQSSQSKIMKELVEVKQLREHALKQVAQLEKEVLELRLEREKSGYHMQERMIHKDRSRSLSRSSRRKRMKSPQPTNRIRTDVNLNPLSDISIACRAVETVEDVYSSDLATYIVRKPYGGNETMEYSFPQKNGESMNNCRVSWHQPVKTYLKTAKVQEEASIEVISRVEADNSILLLHGSSCRHGIALLGNEGSTTGYDWKIYDDIEKMDGSLGRIIYIDASGNDGEYWLDSIYEEALKIRENYCSNVYSAALALKASSPKTSNCRNQSLEEKKDHVRNVSPVINVASQHVMDSESHHRNAHNDEPMLRREKAPVKEHPVKAAPKMVDACVGTEDLPKLEVPEKNIPRPKVVPKPVSQESNPEIESGSTDALSAFVIFFFGTIFSIVWFGLCIPFKIIKWTSLASILCISISAVWLYLADDNGAMNLGAGIDYHLNSPRVH